MNNNYYNVSLNYFLNNLNNYFRIENVNYSISFIFQIVKVEYNIGFYDKNNSLILPSDLSLYYNYSIICHIESKFIYLTINSFANIYQNKFYNCIEFLKINEKINFGITIYNFNNSFYINLFSEEIIKYNNLKNKDDKLFDSIFVNYKYLVLIKKINNKQINQFLKLKTSFVSYPFTTLKRNVEKKGNIWIFENIYNNYFCFCIGKDCFNKISQKCKFDLYQYVIDNNRNLYKKTDFLFVDFIFNGLSSDDVYPIFKEMERQKLPVYYVTEKLNIYNRYCKEINKCNTIILVDKYLYINYGDFVEKYLSIILRLKSVISGKYINKHYISFLFYDIDYITYIAVGHGLCYFKDYLYGDYRLYGRKRNDKILIPNSDKIIYIAKKYGWEDKDIIKIDLPRWDYYINNNTLISSLNNKDAIKNNSIFIMFTWRDMKKNKKISSYYINNIKELLNHIILNNKIKEKKIIIYFSFHRYIIDNYFNIFRSFFNKHKQINYIEQIQISECLSKTSLVVTDFSSIIFDLMVRKKPFILYIPDSDDPQLKDIYTLDYYNLILSFKNQSMTFENLFFNINDTINKIIYYININFNLESKLLNFYKSFNLKNGNNIIKFIDYLKNLK